MFLANPLPYHEVRRPFILGTATRQWKATLFHRFVELVHAKGKLARHFTQNIDGLDYQCDSVSFISSSWHGNDGIALHGMAWLTKAARFLLKRSSLATAALAKLIVKHAGKWCRVLKNIANKLSSKSKTFTKKTLPRLKCKTFCESSVAAKK